MDLILGAFADTRLNGLTGPELDQYERLLDIPDTVLLAWITGAKAAPGDVEPIFRQVRVFSERGVSQTSS